MLPFNPRQFYKYYWTFSIFLIWTQLLRISNIHVSWSLISWELQSSGECRKISRQLLNIVVTARVIHHETDTYPVLESRQVCWKIDIISAEILRMSKIRQWWGKCVTGRGNSRYSILDVGKSSAPWVSLFGQEQHRVDTLDENKLYFKIWDFPSKQDPDHKSSLSVLKAFAFLSWKHWGTNERL